MLILRRCLLHPRAVLYAFDARPVVRNEVRRFAWPAFVAIAVAGTLLYGATLDRPFRLLAATALSWAVFGPALIAITRRKALTCAHACLVTMTYGIAVLAAGAAAGAAGAGPAAHAGVVLASNVVMAAALVRQLAALGVPAWRTLLAWIVVLDGTGLALFALFGGFA